MKNRIIFFLLAITTWISAGVEPVAPGKVFVQNTVKYLKTETYYNKKGELQNISPTQHISSKLYGEIGIWNHMALIFNVDYYSALIVNSEVVDHKEARVLEETLRGSITSGLGSSEVGVKALLYEEKRFSLGLEALVGIPGTPFQSTQSSPEFDGIDRSQFPGYRFEAKEDTDPFAIPIGYNDWQTTLFLRAGTMLGAVEVSGGAGYQLRTKDNNNGLIIQANAGFVPFGSVYWNFGLYSYMVMGTVDTQYEYETLSISTSGYYGITPHFGLIAGLEGAFFNKNTLSAIVPSAGLYISF
jgi:hypothetical protein